MSKRAPTGSRGVSECVHFRECVRGTALVSYVAWVFLDSSALVTCGKLRSFKKRFFGLCLSLEKASSHQPRRALLEKA